MNHYQQPQSTQRQSEREIVVITIYGVEGNVILCSRLLYKMYVPSEQLFISSSLEALLLLFYMLFANITEQETRRTKTVPHFPGADKIRIKPVLYLTETFISLLHLLLFNLRDHHIMYVVLRELIACCHCSDLFLFFAIQPFPQVGG